MNSFGFSNQFFRRFFIFFAVVFCAVFSVFAQTARKAKAGFESDFKEIDKVFIENKGQFKNKNSNTIVLFGASLDKVTLYFSNSGITYRYDSIIKKEEEGTTEREEEEEREVKTYFMKMRWLGANPNVEILSESKVNHYYTYSVFDENKNSSVKANAFEKIIYKNIYPHIDIEYFFPENKSGIKYNIILYPGADPSMIKMQYDGIDQVKTDAEGNVIITSVLGKLIDHAPFTYYEGGKKIKSSFVFKNKTVSFKTELNGPVSEKVIIDPWTTVISGFATSLRQYDVDWDYQGNIYAYGEGPSGFLTLVKLNILGIVQWSYSFGYSSGVGGYGDFAIDRNTGTAYLVDGLNMSGNGARILKVNTLGNLINTFPGNPDMREFWRISYNSCTNQGAIGGGCTVTNYQACTFDTALVNITPLNIFSTNEPTHDIALIAIDDADCYMATAKSSLSNGTNTNFDNIIAKCPLPALQPLGYVVPNGHKFREASSALFYDPSDMGNGFNGMAKSANYLYTYDGAVLKKWNPANGAFISSVIVSTDTFKCAGIAVDDCDNVFVGMVNGVREYDSAFAVVSFASTVAEVYDVSLFMGAQILVSGKGFVSTLPFFFPCSQGPTFNINATGSTCTGNDGTATVNITSGTPPYSYLWEPGGQTTATATGLSPGMYQVLVYEQNPSVCRNSRGSVDTVVITATSGFTQQSATTTPIDCYGDSTGTATENVLGGTAPFTYLWSDGQTTATAVGLAQGTYTVTVQDSIGCQTIDSVTIGPPPDSMNFSAFQIDVYCAWGLAGSITTNVMGGTAPYTYNWLPSGSTAAEISGLTPGTYTLSVTDNKGCVKTEKYDILLLMPINVNVSGPDSVCMGDSTFLNATGAGNFIWQPGNLTGSSVTVNPSSIVTYTVTGYNTINGNNNICSDTAYKTIVVNLLPTVTAGTDDTICFGQSTVFMASGGGGTYGWNTGSSNQNITATIAGDYIVTLTDTNNCSDADTVHLTIDPLPPLQITGDTTLCIGESSTLTASGANNYLWNTGSTNTSITINPTTPITYILTGSNTNGCSDTLYIPVTVNQLPTITVSPDDTICSGEQAQVMVVENNYNYQWTPAASLNTSTMQSPLAGPIITTTYTVICTDNNGCMNTDTVRIVVELSATAAFTPTPTEGQIPLTINFTNTSSDASSYEWNFGDNTQSTEDNPIHVYTEGGEYTVQLIANNDNQCPDTTIYTYIKIDASSVIWIPNSFSPNDDGINDVFKVSGYGITEINVSIYDRWGEEIYNWNTINGSWDGAYNGKEAELGVYVYVVKAKGVDGKTYNRTGHVSLVR